MDIDNFLSIEIYAMWELLVDESLIKYGGSHGRLTKKILHAGPRLESSHDLRRKKNMAKFISKIKEEKTSTTHIIFYHRIVFLTTICITCVSS